MAPVRAPVAASVVFVTNRKFKVGLISLLALGSVVACGSGTASQPSGAAPASNAMDHNGSTQTKAGAVTRLLTQELPDVQGKEGMIEVVDFAPGEASQEHRHNSDVFVYVLQGAIETQVKGGDLKTMRAGDTFYESPTDIHVVSRNVSTTEPAKIAVFYVKAKGTPPTEILAGSGK